ncbi:hypothetical protein PY479_15535 [Shewanella sp. A32]|uniref:hypothetical protein n=1 Tax=Shewanella sp. A32 TaxID=3031327 RepID=UPI0023B9BAB9|nr:hypothetical protein [Shewanella sp. A32]MDF0535684.1 hypothetical protein [Shewanella sp. A32]
MTSTTKGTQGDCSFALKLAVVDQVEKRRNDVSSSSDVFNREFPNAESPLGNYYMCCTASRPAMTSTLLIDIQRKEQYVTGLFAESMNKLAMRDRGLNPDLLNLSFYFGRNQTKYFRRVGTISGL